MVDQNLIKHLFFFVDNLEEKLSSVKIVHKKLDELMSIVSKTHETILDDLTIIKKVLNQTTIEEEDDEIIPIDATKSEWDDDDDDDQIESKNVRQNDNSISNSSSTNISSSISKRSSNLKNSDQLTTRIKSPKSVTFGIEKNIPNQQQKKFLTNVQQVEKEKKNSTFNEIITTPIISSSPSDLSKQNQSEIKAIIGKTLTNIRIHEIESENGHYLRLLNVSNSDDYDLTEHFLQQNINSIPICRFQFPFNTIIRAGQTVTVWCGHSNGINPQPPHILLWKEQRKWETRPECVTILAKPNGQSIAWYRNFYRVNTDQSSSDILFVRSKSNTGLSDASSISSSSIKSISRPITRQSRFSEFNLIGNNKPPFAHSPNNPIHPDHNGITVNIPNDIRSQMHQRGGIPRLLKRPKSSPYASHRGCKQDLITVSLLRTQKQKQTTIKT